MNGAGLFFLLLLLLVILPIGGWVGYTRWRAHKQGLPPPSWSSYIPFKKSSNNNYPGSSSSGPIGWVKDKWSTFQSHRAGSGYAGAQRGQRGYGNLDPDAAWDDRVGHEADTPYGAGYEEQELGLHPPHAGSGAGSGRVDEGPYGMHGGGYAGSRAALPAYGEERGRTRSREDLSHVGGGQRGLDERYDEVVHGQPAKSPYRTDRHDEGALRGLSPRPHEMDATSMNSGREGRHSMFREEI